MATSLNKVITRNADNTINTSTNYSELNVKASNLTNNLVTHLEAQITTMEGAMQAKEGAVDVKIASLASVGTSTYTTPYLDRSLTMLSKAEFNAVAAERRANRAGSGFDEFGLGTAGSGDVNQGITTFLSASYTNSFFMPLGGVTKYPESVVNGVKHKLQMINGNAYNQLLLPPAPTVLPSTATLTQQQIDSGVIKHADASNSGLIVNGKFDTDTSGWTSSSVTQAIVAGELQLTLTSTSGGSFSTAFPTVIGKTYTYEFEGYRGTATDIQFYAQTSAGITISQTTAYTNTTKARYTLSFTATTTSSMLLMRITGTSGQTAYFDNIAVFPADAISRSDLVFLESWHEDISEKGVVYRYGNVQFKGASESAFGTQVTPSAGTPVFAGYGTYSLFSDTWQADEALIGNCYIWANMTDVQKKAFVADPENNSYLDGDKVIQVRYRMRVVMGIGDTWLGAYSQINLDVYASMGYKAGALIQAKGKTVSITKDFSIDGAVYYQGANATNSLGGQLGNGHFAIRNDSFGTPYAYEAKAYTATIALTHRRNKGGYDLTYNPNGTKTMTMTPTCIADCFTEANYTAATGYIGTSTSRPDGLFYDQVSVEDFKPANKGADLRNTSKKRNAQSIIEEFAPKVIAGTIPFYSNDTTALTTYKDEMEVRDTSGNRYGMVNKIGNVVTINAAVANKKGFTVVTQNGKQYLQVADDATSDATVQMNLSTIKYDVGVFDA